MYLVDAPIKTSRHDYVNDMILRRKSGNS